MGCDGRNDGRLVVTIGDAEMGEGHGMGRDANMEGYGPEGMVSGEAVSLFCGV